jgi:hypothetical protein
METVARRLPANRRKPCLPALLGLAVLAIAPQARADVAAAKGQQVYAFPSSGLTFDASFEGAALGDCIQLGEDEYQALIEAENRPINNSPWYAFRVTSESARTITVRLTYEGGSHRYPPKTSGDGVHWTPLASEKWSKGEGSATLRLDVGPQPLWVAAQEMIGCDELDAWIGRLARLPFAERGVVGRSIGRRPIWKLELNAGRPQGCVFVIGRQHPPEVTGTIALMSIVETLAGPGEVAEAFRRQFKVVVVPLVNPDGVAAGHWRSNLGGVDLNRDWGPFRQPETQAVRDEILKYGEDGAPPLALLLDFHSTQQDLFYVQGDDQPTRPPGFTREWLEALSRRMPDYTVRSIVSEAKRPTSAKWGYDTFGVPAITCEYGDNTDRELIRRAARTAAEEMMRLMLAEVGEEPEKVPSR